MSSCLSPTWWCSESPIMKYAALGVKFKSQFKVNYLDDGILAQMMSQGLRLQGMRLMFMLQKFKCYCCWKNESEPLQQLSVLFPLTR